MRSTVRQPEPGRVLYDAYMYCLLAPGPTPAPGLGAYLYAAALPLRGVLNVLGLLGGSVASCVPMVTPVPARAAAGIAGQRQGGSDDGGSSCGGGNTRSYAGVVTTAPADCWTPTSSSSGGASSSGGGCATAGAAGDGDSDCALPVLDAGDGASNCGFPVLQAPRSGGAARHVTPWLYGIFSRAKAHTP